MLEYKDLMIGDLLLHKGQPIKVEEILIDGINPMWDGSESYGNEAYYEDLQPIPITPEILEKNFGKPYPRGGFHNYRMEKDETIAFVIEDRRVSAAPDNRVVLSRCPGTYICDVNYIHELQHALRLCGIEKEIVL